MEGAVTWTGGNERCTTLIARPAPQPSFIPAPGREPFSLVRPMGVIWRSITHLRTHRDVLRFLLKKPLLLEMIQEDPRFPVKYLTRDFLVKGFSVTESASCFLHHYKRLHELLPHHLLRQTLQEEITLHEIPAGGNLFALTMGLSRPYDNQGEMTLSLRVDGEIVFVLAFTIVPGWVVNSPEAETLLITRLQGIKGRYDQISMATRALEQVAPSRVLVAALQGVADAFGITSITAISAVRQGSYSDNSAASFLKAYDEFFAELGLHKNEAGWLSTPIPIQEKPLKSIKRGHRLRARRRRAFKKQIQLACAGFFKDFVVS